MLKFGDPMTNALFYTFSTIAQALATTIALLAGFLLYRLQLLGSAIADNFERICGTLEAIHGYKVRNMLHSEQYGDVLKLAAETNFPENTFQAQDERARLPNLLAAKEAILAFFWRSLYATAGMILFSVFALIMTPQVAESPCWTWVVFVVGFVWFVACIISYVLFLKKAF
jgi:hypothetical protein